MKMKPSPRLLTLALVAAPHPGWAQAACEPQRLVSPPTSMPIRFGQDVATNGAQWFITDQNARTLPGPSSAGAVHVYNRVDGRLMHRQTITPADAAQWDVFGNSISVDGNRMLVGSMGTRVPTTGDRAGAGFIYEFDGEEWIETARLWPVSVDQEFGGDVVLSDRTAVIRPLVSNDLHMYREANGEWVFEGFMQPDGASALPWQPGTDGSS